MQDAKLSTKKFPFLYNIQCISVDGLRIVSPTPEHEMPNKTPGVLADDSVSPWRQLKSERCFYFYLNAMLGFPKNELIWFLQCVQYKCAMPPCISTLATFIKYVTCFDEKHPVSAVATRSVHGMKWERELLSHTGKLSLDTLCNIKKDDKYAIFCHIEITLVLYKLCYAL